MPTAEPIQQEEQQVLAQFDRRNKKTGAPEVMRVAAGSFNGRNLTHLRIFFQGRPQGPDHDGWYPSTNGVTVRETELDEVIEALQRVRAAVQKEGRSTGPEPGKATRTPHSRPTPAAASRPPAPPAPAQFGDDEDDIPF